MANEVAELVKVILNQREGVVLSDITVKPQKHTITRKNVTKKCKL